MPRHPAVRRAGFLAALLLAAGLAAPAAAQPLSIRDSFRIGSGGGTLCTGESLTTNVALIDMFDRGWSIVCRDAAMPVGTVYALRARGGDPAGRLATLRNARMACRPGEAAAVEGLGRLETLDCRLSSADIGWRVYLRPAGGTLYVAEGFAGYDSALRLALRSVIADRELPGEVSIATTGAGDPAAFARIQAGTHDPQRALAEAYRRNNAGSFAEAAEYFATLTERGDAAVNPAEALLNEAMQKSDLGRFAEAETLFARAAPLAGADPVTARRLRNYQAMHLLNQGLPDAALAQLNRPVPPIAADDALRNLVIDPPTSGRLSAESPGASRLRGQEGLTQADKAQILDGQALQLRGTILRLQHRDADAAAPFGRAMDELVAIRGGRIAATIWLRAQILGELAGIAEARGDAAEAERLHRAAIALLESDYPGSAALLSAQGRLAGFYVRAGRTADALALYHAIVASISDRGDASPGLRLLLGPYFETLAGRGDDPQAVADLFAASQVLVRPGVAQTQAILARELSGGSDAAAALFRQSVDLTRDIERARVELSRLQAGPQSAAVQARAAALQASLAQWQQDQIATQARLANYPRYRVVSNGALTLADLQHLLRSGEAYYKMLVVGDRAYAIFATAAGARAFRLGVGAAELDRRVDALRRTISIIRGGEQITYPFDLELAYGLYQALFGPVSGDMAGVTHLIFEPDGAMMRLPPNLLVMDHAGIDAYKSRAARPGDDGFDFTGVQWLGRDRDVSTSVSARAFRDVRQAPPSRARAAYLGFGQNQPVGAALPPGAVRSAPGNADCSWPAAAWNRPISAAELVSAGRAASGGRPGQAEIVTGAAFSDSAILARRDLADHRILHFATHGLVIPPRPQCPSRPALLTSFGGAGSDGLLSFAEIFDLRLDADLIILSACDTAGGGSAEASAEAGVGGGEFALDGLVRAFVGAGGRMVVASHWPLPDDFDATQRLNVGLFSAPPGTSTAGALRRAERSLMDDPRTSHPFYWAGFALIGDGAAPVLRPIAAETASAH
ncbi:MAG: CHAT domain-containing protein [Sphingomonadaceae bacterium]|nr:CHAT domain-containing protein [Sphingomonadaceae bacterium]